MSHEKHHRSFIKAISWRCLATLTTFVISYFVTGSFHYATAISVIEVVVKIVLFYLHERIWHKIPLGKVKSH